MGSTLDRKRSWRSLGGEIPAPMPRSPHSVSSLRLKKTMVEEMQRFIGQFLSACRQNDVQASCRQDQTGATTTPRRRVARRMREKNFRPAIKVRGGGALFDALVLDRMLES